MIRCDSGADSIVWMVEDKWCGIALAIPIESCVYALEFIIDRFQGFLFSAGLSKGRSSVVLREKNEWKYT